MSRKLKINKKLFINKILASTNKNNLISQQVHRTKEAETKVKELSCFTCDMVFDGEDCLNINQTRTRQTNLTKKCSSEEIFCSVKRFSYTIADKNSTSEKKLWSLQRNCTEKCENSCIIIGERTKLYACETCCDNNLCNVGSSGRRNEIKAGFMMVFSTYVFLMKFR